MEINLQVLLLVYPFNVGAVITASSFCSRWYDTILFGAWFCIVGYSNTVCGIKAFRKEEIILLFALVPPPFLHFCVNVNQTASQIHDWSLGFLDPLQQPESWCLIYLCHLTDNALDQESAFLHTNHIFRNY